jgi:hypothetical protein
VPGDPLNNSEKIGHVTFSEPDVLGAVRARIITDGRCVTETIDAMVRGDRGKAMPRDAAEGIRTQAVEILESIVDAYENDVACGELGEERRAKAAQLPPRLGKCPTGLLYGRVQSGKTAAMIVTTALALDNGFRVVVVLTSNNLKLVEQTTDRFRSLDSALTYSSLGAGGGGYDWERDRTLIQKFIGQRGAVFVCAKEDGHLRALIRFLQSIEAAQYPALIMDDEADHATPDTQLSARTRGRQISHGSTTFRLVVENDKAEEAGVSLRETLTHNVFLQVTATPYGLLLQNLTSSLRPAFTRLLRPGTGYTGGEAFFAQVEDKPVPPLVYVPETEAAELTNGAASTPEGLKKSVAFFVVAAAAHRLTSGRSPKGGYKYLCHTSVKREVHRQLESLILQYVDSLASRLADDVQGVKHSPELVWALSELKRTVGVFPDEEELWAEVARYLPTRSMQVVNSEQQTGQLRFDAVFNFLVGGNILGRGLTIDDLLVTYYLRQARVTQMDTMHQHARMYGYRAPLMPFTRVFLTQTLAQRFRAIHDGEEALRNLLHIDNSGRSIPVEVAGELKPTRSNILDIGSISAYRPGQQVYPVEPVHNPQDLGNSTATLTRLVVAAYNGEVQPNVFRRVEVNTVLEMVKSVRVQEDDSDWNTNAIVKVLTATAERYSHQADLYVRAHHPGRVRLASGAISGEEQRLARERNSPVLFMFEGKKGSPWLADIWYPTVVFPTDMPAMIFNRDS